MPPPPDRRTLLLSAAALLGLSAVEAPLPPPAAAADAACEYATAPSGLQFCDVREGGGASPPAGAMIRAHYEGRLDSNGAVFDSSYDRGRPLSFKIGVGQVIKGWDAGILGAEGVPPMKEGGLRLLRIPPQLAYGERGAGGVIPPNGEGQGRRVAGREGGHGMRGDAMHRPPRPPPPLCSHTGVQGGAAAPQALRGRCGCSPAV